MSPIITTIMIHLDIAENVPIDVIHCPGHDKNTHTLHLCDASMFMTREQLNELHDAVCFYLGELSHKDAA